MEPLALEGAWVFTPRIHADLRGSFNEWFAESVLKTGSGRSLNVTQANWSVSRKGVIRGIHFSDVPPGQAKYISCTHGAILDVIVDLRVGSAGFGRWVAIALNAENRRAVFLEEGLGHGFVALSDEATVLYMCSTPYAPQREHGINPFDPDLAIEWPADLTPVLSDKDAAAPSLAAASSGQLLPCYALCQAYASALRGGQVA